ncbi:hypothetical protein RCL1_007957 [Eukaryota sp. TZLM3-RCL]
MSRKIESEFLKVVTLGAGSEVGRSCIVISYHGKSVMLDCGIHPAETGENQLPFFDAEGFEPANIDLVLISHFHLDHIGALPYFCTQTNFNGPVLMTYPTRSVYRIIMSDFLRQPQQEAPIFTEKDLDTSLRMIKAVQYHQVVEHDGIRVWCYNAGHVLGAAMWMVEIAGVRVLYTGDFSRQEDRHLKGAETPGVRPDVVIVESTYGVSTHRPREERERQFTESVGKCIRRRGKCLIPVFALGRAQELLLILDEYWEANPDLQNYNIYYASSLAQRCMPLFQTSITSMNEAIQERSNVSNPFQFKHIRYLKDVRDLDHSNPCVVMASPGMLQSGDSRTLFDLWCTDDRNMVLIPGYSVKNTLAHTLQSDPPHVVLADGRKVPKRIEVVSNISFSAHSDSAQTKEFLDVTNPRHVVLVHGEMKEMNRFKNDLKKTFDKQGMQFHTPQNTIPFLLRFKQEPVALVRGSLAETASRGGRLDGLLLRQGLDLSIVADRDLPTESSFEQLALLQSLTLPPPLLPLPQVLEHFPVPLVDTETGWSVGDINLSIVSRDQAQNSDGNLIEGQILIEWEASIVDDLLVDSLIIAILKGQEFVDYCNAFCDSC